MFDPGKSKFSKQSRGATLLEFTVVLALLLIVTFGIVEFSLLMFDKAVLTNACREGARAGIVSQSPRMTDAEIRDVVMEYCRNYLVTFGGDTLEAGDISVSPSDRTGLPYGTDLTVTVSYQYEFLVLSNLVDSLVGPVELQATAVMKLE